MIKGRARCWSRQAWFVKNKTKKTRVVLARARARARDGTCLDVAIPATLEPLLTPLRTRDHESMPLGRAPSDCITRPFLGISPAVDRDDQATGISTRLVGGQMHAEFTPPIAHRYPHVRVAHRQRACCHGRQDEHCASCSARNYHLRESFLRITFNSLGVLQYEILTTGFPTST